MKLKEGDFFKKDDRIFYLEKIYTEFENVSAMNIDNLLVKTVFTIANLEDIEVYEVSEDTKQLFLDELSQVQS